MKLLEPTQKFIDAYPEGIISENHRFWFNLDLSFIATTNTTEEKKIDNLKQYCDNFGFELSYEELMENFKVSFGVLIQEFKDEAVYKSFNFNL